MFLYDPDGAVFEIDGTRSDLAAEYRDNLRGPFSLELQQVLDKMHTTPLKGRFVLLVLRPFEEFGLARLSGERGVPPEPVPGVSYKSMAAAEWDIFKRRWLALTGLPVGVEDP